MIDVCSVPIKSGGHTSPEDGMCIMEMASYVAREKFSDHPECVSPVIGAFCRSWNDSLSDDDRNRLLRPYIFKVIGTKTNAGDEETRAWMAIDWLARIHTPAWLWLAGLEKEAKAIEGTARIVDAVTAGKAQPKLDTAREAANKKWAAAADAARDAAWGAAGVAAWAAARDAARAAAGAAARDAVRPTVVALQDSALKLLDEMIAIGTVAKETAA